jgi:hypothetical protein
MKDGVFQKRCEKRRNPGQRNPKKNKQPPLYWPTEKRLELVLLVTTYFDGAQG